MPDINETLGVHTPSAYIIPFFILPCSARKVKSNCTKIPKFIHIPSLTYCISRDKINVDSSYMRAWPRACALPVADAAQAQCVQRSVNEEGAMTPTRTPQIANGGIGRHVGERWERRRWRMQRPERLAAVDRRGRCSHRRVCRAPQQDINTYNFIFAGVVELADTLDLGSNGFPCRFKSCRPYQNTYPYLIQSYQQG